MTKQMKKKYKVIIIGAGPAGISTALNLYKLGIKDILVIEKYKFPRYKCCAGYITSKTKKKYSELGLDLDKCHYSLIEDFNIFYNLKKKQNIQNKFLYTNKDIERVELDNAFYELAKKEGIEIIENTEIIADEQNKKTIKVTGNKIIKYDYLVFADGTSGYGSNYQSIKKNNIALQLVLPSKKDNEIQIHFGITKNGYGWVSTYNGITNVGLTDIYKKGVNYKDIFQNFLEDLGINSDIENLKGAFTPFGVRKSIIEDSIYYVGDAVGACDPLTLSGVRYALSSGEFCARAIASNNPKIYIKYINNLKLRFSFMKLLSKIFYLKIILFCIFNIGCTCFSKLISFIFNHFFVNKK